MAAMQGLQAQLDANVSIDASLDTIVKISLTDENTLANTDSMVVEEDDEDKKQTMFLLRESDVLVRLNSLPIYTWNDGIDQSRHIKPLAKDFNKLFDHQRTDETISMDNALGVSLAGIKAISQDLKHYNILIVDLQKSNEELSRKSRYLSRVVEKQRKELELLKRQMADLALKVGK